jgi:hypothetical protein
MQHDPKLPTRGTDPSGAIIAACKAARQRLDAAADAVALTVAVAELACTLSFLEEALIEWAMSADPRVGDTARRAIATAARRPH